MVNGLYNQPTFIKKLPKLDKSICLLALPVLFLFQKTFSQTTRTFYEHEFLYGKVKQVNESQYLYILKKKSGPSLTDTAFYDQQGHTLAVHTKPRPGYLYVNTFAIASGLPGKPVEISSNRDGEEIIARIDSTGLLAECDRYFENRQIVSRSFYTYDNKGDLVKLSVFDMTGHLEFESIFSYNRKHRLMRQRDYFNGGQRERHFTFSYEGFDQWGNWTRRTCREILASAERNEVETLEREIIYY